MPGLVAAGIKHYGCTSFTGMFLENEGTEASAGAHFEKIMAGNEVMTAQATGKMVLSFWTLNLLNDCGWYKIDFSKAENLANKETDPNKVDLTIPIDKKITETDF